MKTQRKNGQGLYLQKNKRWKWLAGATAATAAGVTASQASTITLNLVGNYISGSGGNHLNADLTGDGQPDLTIANSFFFSHHYATTYGATFYRFAVRVELNGVIAYGRDNGEYPSGSVQLGSQHGFHSGNYGAFSLTGSIPIFFKDLHINGGALTKGSLEVTVQESRVQLDSFTYNTPDQGSSLALLAMGAAGIFAFRRWRAMQARS